MVYKKLKKKKVVLDKGRVVSMYPVKGFIEENDVRWNYFFMELLREILGEDVLIY